MSALILCLAFSEAICFATDYYVDAWAGNDGNTGRSTTAAWRTVGKVNSSSFVAGDRILFKRGQTWREQLTIPSSGTSGNPIVYGAYGTGARPSIRGSALVTNWTSAGSNQWRASLGSQPNQVFFNEVRGTKKSSQGGVTSARSWYWASGTLTVYSTTDPDSGTAIEASVRPSTRSYGVVHVQNRSYVTIESLEVTQSASFGLYIKPTGTNITVRDCEVSHSLDGGLVAPNSGGTAANNLLFEGCLVHHNNGGYFEGDPGVATYHEGLTIEMVDGFVIRGCQVYNNYMEGSNFKRGARNGVIENCLLYSNALINQYVEGSTNIEIRYNKIYDCTYNAGIEFGLETDTRHNDNIRIHHNVFWGNAGGISFWAGSVAAQTRNINIHNNTFYGDWEAIRWKSGATDNYSGTNYIRNNLFWQNGSGNTAIKDYTSGRQAISRTTIAYNAFQQGMPTDTTGSYARVISDPLFVAPSSRDFHLRSGSLCIDTGTNVGATRDFDGTAIPQGSGPDIGTFEYRSGTTTAYTLTVSATNGTVTRTPNQSSYASGTTVTLQATPISGYAFTGWSGALTGTTNPATLVMNANKSVTANFAPIPATTYTLSVSATNGTVTRTPNQSSYASGTTVTLQATPNSGYMFTGWSGALTGTTNPATLVMNANKSVTASFAPIPATTYTLSVSATNGTVTRTPNQSSYASGTTVTLQATPNSGYMFTGWSGALTGTTNPATLVMNSNKSITANFAPVSGAYKLTIRCKNGSVTRMPSGPQYSAGQRVTLQATPKSGYVFSRWSGALSGSTNPTTIVMDSDKYVLAYFVRSSTTYSLTTNAANGTVTKSPEKSSYYAGEAVMLQATPRSGYTFTGWSGALTGALNPARVVVDTNKSVTANFAPVGATASTMDAVATEEMTLAAQTIESVAGVDEAVEAAAEETPVMPEMPGLPSVSDSADNTWTIWQTGDAGQQQIFISRVSGGDETLVDVKQLSIGAGDHCNPAIAMDAAGVLYATWQENVRGNWDVRVSVSADGSTWSAPTLIVDSDANQTSPAISTGEQPEDPVTILWQDDHDGTQDVQKATSADAFLNAEVTVIPSDTGPAGDETDASDAGSSMK